ncbi:peptidase M16-like protein [Paraglaciecola sp. T6c]|uniref:M16 family metallopeptidase n=1 Tax=Pseudoalteromonas atlantica (strain T6c / ATCC BAA-1087) TaxID=3042615 RepID=UPI00005C5249|nr:pitrilysin family protein [Paraglaciecola sp. T6c]ABG39891.1 peptidase M16-like protein [Paraglaciecola sp. T6c]
MGKFLVVKKIVILSTFAGILSACQPTNSVTQPTTTNLPTGVTLVAEQGASDDQVRIPYKKYRLANGLTLVLHEDHSDPLVHVDVTYHVGSAREEVGKSGFAHFFEHMMFQGSKNVADDEHIKIVTEAGGNMNGTTNSDRTNYYETVPANQLEKMMWLEADRMGFLLGSVTQEKFEIQRETVKNERGQSYDNQPYGLRSERNSEALYPAGHPYSWSTIGYIEDLNRVNVDDLKAFFKRWYGPNNAVLTIGGDIEPEQVLGWANKYFGSIPAGPSVKNAEKELVTLDEARFVTLEDEIHLPLLQVTFPTVYVRHEDEAPLDVLSNILGAGKTSLFYKNLVKDGYAVQAMVSHPCRELACEFQLIALANPQNSTNLSELYARFEQTLAEFEERGVSEDDLNRTKVGIESSTIFGLQSVSGKVSTLASNQTFDGEPDMVQYDLDRYNAVTAQDVMRVYQRYIKDKPSVVLSIVPNGQVDLAAKPANFTVPKRQLDNIKTVQAHIEQATIVDTFDRSVQPPAGPSPVVSVPDFDEQRFENGLTLVSLTTDETPTVSISFNMEGGPLLDPIDKAGLASFTAQMMNETTKGFTNEEMANQLALLGSSIRFDANGRFTTVRINSLSRNLDATLALFKKKMFSPAFLQSDFQRLKQRSAQSLQQQVKNPSVLASRAVSELLFGKDNRVSLPDSGTLNTIQNISLDDVKAYYQQYYSPSKANVVVVGDVNTQSLQTSLDFLTNWPAKPYQIKDYAEFPKMGKPVIYLVDKPGAKQSVVSIFKPYLPYDATGEQFRSKLMNFALGGVFSSRINLNLREDKGYTYGASTNFIGGKTLGWFNASADLKQDNTVDGIREMLSEITEYHEKGMTQTELELMRNAFTQGDALEYETPSSKAGFLRHLLTYGLDKSYRGTQNKIIHNIGKDELNALAAKVLDPNSMQVVVVGDASVIRAQLATLGREVVDLTVEY